MSTHGNPTIEILESLEQFVNRTVQNKSSDTNSEKIQEPFDAVAKLEGKATVAPFDVWKYKGKYILVDGRFAEYRWAVKNKVQFTFNEHTFKDLRSARIFMISNLLKKPNLSAGLRILAAQTLKDDFRAIARSQQGRRTDLKFEKLESQHTHVSIAKLARVSPASATHFSSIQKHGDRFLGKKETANYINEICTEVTSIGAVYRKLQQAMEMEEKKGNFVRDELKKASQKSQSNPEKTVRTEALKPNNVIHHNPSTSDGYENKILHGDNREILKKLPSNWATVVLTSPAYNVDNVNYDIPFIRVPYAQYLKDLEPVIIESARILRDGGTLAYNIADVRAYGDDRNEFISTPIVADIVEMVRNFNLPLKYFHTQIWYKNKAFKRQNKGSLSPTCPEFKTNHEYLIIFKKNDFKLQPIGNAPSDLTHANYLDWTTSVWEISPVCPSKNGHPCPFPPKLVQRVVKMFSFVGDIICDPYNGSGTSTATAASLGRKWFGCDLSERYCASAERRTNTAYQEFLNSHSISIPKAA